MSPAPNSSVTLNGVVPISNAFLFEVDGVQIGVFNEVRGLELNVEVVSYEEGGNNGFTHQLPGRLSWPNITLKRGVCDSDALLQWVQQVAGEGFTKSGEKFERCTGAITVLSRAGVRLKAWNLREVMPVKWTGPTFSVDDLRVLEEELVVAHHGFTVKDYKQAANST